MDAIALARALIAVDTAGKNEDAGIAVLAPLLEASGFDLVVVPWKPGRSNLVATWRGGGDFVLSGHVDTVPFDSAGWSTDPLDSETRDGWLIGRGSSDMKGGLAAMTVAAIEAASAGAAPFSFVVTSAEEAGCHGGRAVVEAGMLASRPLVIIGESTDNGVRLGHKGATWLEVEVRGRAAHGSRPDLGSNAIDRLADALVAVRTVPSVEHAFLGARTTNVGTIEGGVQTNLVADHCIATVDVRTVPGGGPDEVAAALASSGGQVREILSLPAVWTDEAGERARSVREIVTRTTGRDSPPSGVSYFTDGAVFAAHADADVIVLGPGDIDQPHRVDEACRLDRIDEATEIYRRLLDEWTTGALR